MSDRRAMLAKIHVAKKQLDLEDGAYREIIHAVTGKDSAKDLSDAQLHKILGHFQKLGFRATSQSPKAKASGKPLARKILALWGELEKSGALKNASPAALSAFVKRQTGVEALQWLTAPQANKVVEGLKAILARKRESDARAAENHA